MNQSIKLAGIAVVGAGIGFAVGYKIAEKQMSARFEERLAEETQGMKEFYETVRKPYASPEDAVKELIEEAPGPVDPRVPNGRVQYHKVQPKPAEDEVIDIPEKQPVQNVFSKVDPYIIDQEAFMANDPEHTQTTLTYYEKSDQVCGEADEPIDNSEIVVGTLFKTRFGEGSSDKNVVHVRNDDLRMDFEVVRSEGSYEEEVLGETPDSSVPPHKRVKFEGR